MIIGVDIGLLGAISFHDDNGYLLDVEDMPTLKDGSAKRRTINAALLANLLRRIQTSRGPITHAFVEYVSARPGEGAVGAFAFGRCRGVIEGVLGAFGIPVTFITPACWKRNVGLPAGTDKDASRSMAIQRWPEHAGWFRRKMDNGRADAANIAIAGLIRRSATQPKG